MKKTTVAWLCGILIMPSLNVFAEDDNPCGITLRLTRQISYGESQKSQAIKTMVATNIIDRDAKADYQAGQSITLMPGFSAERGASFTAQVKSCSCDQNSLFTEADVNQLTLTAYPNPFVETTVIRYRLSEASPVNLSLFNEQGKIVDVLVNNEIQEAGLHEYTYRNSTATTMIYLYSLKTKKGEVSKRLIKQL